MENHAAYLPQWRLLAESKLGWVDNAEWNDSDFEKLSELIFTSTGVRLSITTLKRIWGRVKYESSPNIATLNALARFTGFDDWRGFRQHCEQVPEKGTRPEEEHQPEVKTEPIQKSKRVYLPVWIGSAAILILAIILISSRSTGRQDNLGKNRHVSFTARKVTEGLPNSVVFDYSADVEPGDSLTLQQNWDSRRTEGLSAAVHQHTSIYYMPGYFASKLLINGQIVKETPVYIQTKGWVGLINKSPKAIYLNPKAIREGNALGITPEQLAVAGGTSIFNDQWTEFFNVRPFGDLNGDDFSFEASIRNTSALEQSSCRKMVVNILGTVNAIVLPFSASGCTSALNVFTSSEWLNGKDHDLSALGCDGDQYQKISVSVNHRQFTVMLNGKTVLSKPITQNIGRIAGICIGFEGAGQISNVKLANSSKIYYHEDFTGAAD